MPNAHGRQVDTTYLSIDTAEKRNLLHRDYIAHTLRWSHICKFVNKQRNASHISILDIGCGKELPLLKTLYVNRLKPTRYIGVDVGMIVPPKELSYAMLNNILVPELHPMTDFGDIDKVKSLGDLKDITIITCFEVLEHVEFEHCERILKNIFNIANNGTTIFISTPNFNGKAADNHVNEMPFNVLKDLLLKTGFTIEKVYGTFASQKDIVSELSKDNLYSCFLRLKEYYDDNYISTIFAPLYPEQSRNCIWIVKKPIIKGVNNV